MKISCERGPAVTVSVISKSYSPQKTVIPDFAYRIPDFA